MNTTNRHEFDPRSITATCRVSSPARDEARVDRQLTLSSSAAARTACPDRPRTMREDHERLGYPLSVFVMAQGSGDGWVPDEADRRQHHQHRHQHRTAEAPLAVGVDRERLAVGQIDAEAEADQRDREAGGTADLGSDRERAEDRDI